MSDPRKALDDDWMRLVDVFGLCIDNLFKKYTDKSFLRKEIKSAILPIIIANQSPPQPKEILPLAVWLLEKLDKNIVYSDIKIKELDQALGPHRIKQKWDRMEALFVVDNTDDDPDFLPMEIQFKDAYLHSLYGDDSSYRRLMVFLKIIIELQHQLIPLHEEGIKAALFNGLKKIENVLLSGKSIDDDKFKELCSSFEKELDDFSTAELFNRHASSHSVDVALYINDAVRPQLDQLKFSSFNKKKVRFSTQSTPANSFFGSDRSGDESDKLSESEGSEEELSAEEVEKAVFALGEELYPLRKPDQYETNRKTLERIDRELKKYEQYDNEHGTHFTLVPRVRLANFYKIMAASAENKESEGNLSKNNSSKNK